MKRNTKVATFKTRSLAHALAITLACAPSLTFAQDKLNPAKEAKVASSAKKQDVITLADEYSEANPVIAIAILKGLKDQITGERIGERLSDALMRIHGIPSKYFIEPGGDYTAIVFAVKGHLYGPYGLKESLGQMALAGSAFYERVGSPKPNAPRQASATGAAKQAGKR